MTSVQQLNAFDVATFSPAVLQLTAKSHREAYDENRHRIYSLAFWMTDNEMAAEVLMVQAFCRAFESADSPTSEDIDNALIAELRKEIPLGRLTLKCAACDKVVSVRYNTLRVDLERAVVQLPATERMIFLMHDVESYDHERIGSAMGISQEESCLGLHQARLRMRELLTK